ncbi:hypothetical protein AYK26_03380 [Euryarchaeota archaeon SM23-78]|nr:MAG: hypothetical protein AYK26_03380 [Euryarchaeota archaeon SM23-78]MBW3000800.1 hypothetical protein [Candidatus Woesearchaeota archaeon]
MSRWKSRRGQSATNAGVTIILIAVVIVMYILFISPEDRAKLLGEEPPGPGPGPTPGVKQVLLSSTPGRLYAPGINMFEHTMPSFMVFTVTNADELKRAESLYIKNSAFSDKSEELIFFYDPITTADVKLSFNVKKFSGRLIIWLNEYKLFESEVTDASPLPISLPRDYLKTKNSLVFSVSSPGAAFWRVNEYELNNILISGKITDYSGAMAEQHFSIGESEFENLERAVFEFIPDCAPREQGILYLHINNRLIFTSPPDCGVKSSIEISKEFLKPGDNVLVASTNTGAFLIDMPKVTTFLKEIDQPPFYFNVNPALYDAMYFGERGIVLTLRFTDTTSVKRATIEINGYKTFFETQDMIYQTFIDPEFLMIGPNSVKIVPQADPIDVVELRIDVV